MSVIADDIIETFDDNRSEEALRVFAEMPKLGQAIYLTHHGHLREMARRVCPSRRSMSSCRYRDRRDRPWPQSNSSMRSANDHI
jgi:hypothetical protein